MWNRYSYYENLNMMQRAVLHLPMTILSISLLVNFLDAYRANLLKTITPLSLPPIRMVKSGGPHFFPFYLTRERMESAPNMAITAGIGSTFMWIYRQRWIKMWSK